MLEPPVALAYAGARIQRLVLDKEVEEELVCIPRGVSLASCELVVNSLFKLKDDGSLKMGYNRHVYSALPQRKPQPNTKLSE